MCGWSTLGGRVEAYLRGGGKECREQSSTPKLWRLYLVEECRYEDCGNVKSSLVQSWSLAQLLGNLHQHFLKNKKNCTAYNDDKTSQWLGVTEKFWEWKRRKEDSRGKAECWWESTKKACEINHQPVCHSHDQLCQPCSSRSACVHCVSHSTYLEMNRKMNH